MLTAKQLREIMLHAATHADSTGSRVIWSEVHLAYRERDALLDHMRALAQPVPYRPGLPTLEQVQAHEERGGWWMSLRTEHPIIAAVEGIFVSHLTAHDGEVYADDIEDDDELPSQGWSYRPCLPDGTPCAWSGEPDPWAVLEVLR